MPLLFSIPGLGQDLSHALSWTLLHSFWQGMLLAAAAGFIIYLTKRSAPQTRYNLLTILVLIFVAGVALTFALLVNNPLAAVPAGGTAGGSMMTDVRQGPAIASSTIAGQVYSRGIALFNANSGWICLGWLLVIVWRSVELAAGIYRVHELKTRQTVPAGAFWDSRLAELAKRLRLKRRVRLLQSALATVPAVAGFLKPVILFPAGMLAALPLSQVEAILLHELAHIQRRDFVVNLVQQAVEIVFFFNPAVRWVSSLISLERENCCDDIALRETRNKRSYIQALIAFQGPDRQLTPAMANSFSGEGGQLINRVKRIIYNNNKTLNNMEKKLLLAGMVITSTLILAFSPEKVNKGVSARNPSRELETGAKKVLKIINHSILDTVPKARRQPGHALDGTINSSRDGKEYRIVMDAGKVSELYVNGRKIPDAELGSYRAATDKIIAQSKADMQEAEKEMKRSQVEMENAQKDLEASQEHLKQSQKEIEERAAEIGLVEKQMAESKAQMEIAQLQMEQDAKEGKQESEASRKELEQSRKEIAEAKAQVELDIKKMSEDRAQARAELQRSKAEMEKYRQEMIQPQKEMEKSKKDRDESTRLRERVIDELVEEKIISGKQDLASFSLSNDEMKVNGVKQPAEVHRRFKEKFVKSNRWQMQFSR
jgi:bla regulator protein BlaR1